MGELGSEVELHVEASDDLEERARTLTRTTALRDYVERVTLRKAYLIESIAWFARLWQSDPERHSFPYLTTATAGRERYPGLPQGTNGIEVWNRLHDPAFDGDAEPLLAVLLDLLRTTTAKAMTQKRKVASDPEASQGVLRWFSGYLDSLTPRDLMKLVAAVEIAAEGPKLAPAELRRLSLADWASGIRSLSRLEVSFTFGIE